MANRSRNLESFSSKFKTRSRRERGDERRRTDNDRQRSQRRQKGRQRKMAEIELGDE